MPVTPNLARRPPYTLTGEPTAETTERAQEMFEELYGLLVEIGAHDILSGTHSDSRIDPEEVDVQRGDVLVGQRTPQGADVIRWQRFGIGAAATVLKTTDGIDLVYGKVVLTAGATQEVTGILPVANGGSNNSVFTAGSVIFAGPGGTQLIEDNANFFWDDANNRLGLGLNAPTVQLDILSNGLALTNTPTVRLANTTAATSGVTRQISPSLVFSGTAWDTDGGGASKTSRISMFLKPNTGSTPSAHIMLSFDDEGAGFFESIAIGSVVAGGSKDFRFDQGSIGLRNDGRGIFWVSAPLTDQLSSAASFLTGSANGAVKFTIKGSVGQLQLEQNTFGTTGVAPLDIRASDVFTATVPMTGIKFRPASNYGSRLHFTGWTTNPDATVDRDMAQLDVAFSDSVDATRSADFVILLVDSAAALAEKFRFASTGLATIPSINLTSGALGNVDGTVYTPVRSAEVNLDANVTMFEAQYIRVRNTVTVSGRFTADPTAAVATSFEMTLPVASNIGAVEDLGGVAFCGAIAGQGAQIEGSVANNTAVVSWIAVDVTSQSWSFVFSYQVI